MTKHPAGTQDLRAMARDDAPLRSRLDAAAWLWMNGTDLTETLCDLADAADVSFDRLVIEVKKIHARRQRQAAS